MRCGVGDYTHRLAESLAQVPDVNVAVLTSRAAAAPAAFGSVDIFPVIQSWDEGETSTVDDVVRSWPPDVVHIQYPTLGYGYKSLPWLLPRHLYRAGISVVQTWHEVYTPKELLASGLLFGFISKASVPGAVVVVRENYRQQMSPFLKWAFLTKTIQFIQNAAALPIIDLAPSEKEAIRLRYARPNCKLIVFFGFIYARKRIELLFHIADPSDCHLVIIGDDFREKQLEHDNPTAQYIRSIQQLAQSEAWSGKVTMTGFLSDREAASILAAAHAVVLPFLDGGGWNTSVHAAQAQGTFVLTTSQVRRGYDPSVNTYFASEDDVDDMRRALKEFVGRRNVNANMTAETWRTIAQAHVDLYETQLNTVGYKLARGS